MLQGHCGNLTLQGDIIRCDGDCPVPPTGNQCQVLVNGVPSGSSFVIFTSYPPGTQFSCGCNSAPPPCEPAPGGQGCNQTQCPNSGEVCFPRCVTMTATGPVVVDCECRQDIECHIVMGPALPYCEGLCPPGTDCVRSETVNTDGTITYCCDCVPVTTCEPLPDQSACTPVQCPVAGEECQPRCILIGFDGVARVTDCECGSPNECHAELIPGAQIPECIGGCPPGQVCIQRVFATPTPCSAPLGCLVAEPASPRIVTIDAGLIGADDLTDEPCPEGSAIHPAYVEYGCIPYGAGPWAE